MLMYATRCVTESANLEGQGLAVGVRLLRGGEQLFALVFPLFHDIPHLLH
jgi:hypothetical protein